MHVLSGSPLWALVDQILVNLTGADQTPGNQAKERPQVSSSFLKYVITAGRSVEVWG